MQGCQQLQFWGIPKQKKKQINKRKKAGTLNVVQKYSFFSENISYMLINIKQKGREIVLSKLCFLSTAMITQKEMENTVNLCK